VEDSEEIFGQVLGGVEFERDASETEVENASAARRSVSENGIGVGAGHGDAFRLALHGVDLGRFGNLSCTRES